MEQFNAERWGSENIHDKTGGSEQFNDERWGSENIHDKTGGSGQLGNVNSRLRDLS